MCSGFIVAWAMPVPTLKPEFNKHWVLPPPPPVTVYIRGPNIKGYYIHVISIIQLLVRGGQYPTGTCGGLLQHDASSEALSFWSGLQTCGIYGIEAVNI